MKLLLNDGSIFEGSIDTETETEYWIDEYRAFGDIVIINKADIKEILEHE